MSETFLNEFLDGPKEAAPDNALRDQIDPTIAAISTCLIAVSVLTLALVQFLSSRQKSGG